MCGDTGVALTMWRELFVAQDYRDEKFQSGTIKRRVIATYGRGYLSFIVELHAYRCDVVRRRVN